MQRLTKVWRFSPNMEVRGCEPRRFGNSMQDADKGHQGRPSVFLCVQENTQAVGELLELCESAQHHKCRVKTTTSPSGLQDASPQSRFPPTRIQQLKSGLNPGLWDYFAPSQLSSSNRGPFTASFFPWLSV